MIRDLLFRLRWWYRVKRGRCPMGPPPACPEFEEHEIRATYQCVTNGDPADVLRKMSGMVDDYGGRVRTVPINDGVVGGWRVEHDGPALHDLVPAGKQCRCGWINIGVVDG